MTGWELILVGLIAVFVLGPERLPDYAAKLAQLIRKGRKMAEGAKGQLKDQLGPEYDDINWQQYDPRQYDPRRIVREALLEPLEDAASGLRSDPTTSEGTSAATDDAGAEADPRTTFDPTRPVPYDLDAT